MALSFFHVDQLVRGSEAGQQEQVSPGPSRTLSDKDKKGTKSRLDPFTVRKLHSETALRDQARAEETSLKSRPPSRPYTSTDKGKEVQRPILTPRTSRPVTSHSYLTETSSIANVESSKARSLRILGSKRPSIFSLGRSQDVRPKLADADKPQDKREANKQKEEAAADISEPVKIPITAQSTQRRNPLHRTASNAQHQREGAPERVPRVTVVSPIPSFDPAQFLAESLAHVIVGEWLYKDPHKPSLRPQSNVFQRQVGPPPRGSVGVPRKRWFTVDPYQRLLSWSSKWDSTASSRHKQSRKGMFGHCVHLASLIH